MITKLTVHVSESAAWWDSLTKKHKQEYVKEHPDSKYATQYVKETETPIAHTSKSLEPGSSQRKSFADKIRNSSTTVASTITKTFPGIEHALSGLGNLARKKPLEHKQKEALHEMGELILETAIHNIPGGMAVHLGASLGVTAVEHAIKKFYTSKKKDPVEGFVDLVADGIEKVAYVAPDPKHLAAGSPERKALSKTVLEKTEVISQIVNKTFPNLKPASQGLKAYISHKPLTHEHKKAIRSLGKLALLTAIATVPGGLPAHLAAGVGLAAVNYGLKHIRDPKREKDSKGIVHDLVKSIGEGLEHAVVHGGAH